MNRYKVALIESEELTGKCTGCSICEMVCSLSHEGICNRSLSRIKIIRKEAEWIRGSTNYIFNNIVCTQCGYCIGVCPVSAISRDPSYGSITIDHQKCIRCNKCIVECSFNALFLDRKNNKILGCDLCQSTEDKKPQCVEFCPTKVLHLIKIGDQNG